MKPILIVAATTAFLAGLAIGSPAFAQMPPGLSSGPHPGPHGMPPMMGPGMPLMPGPRGAGMPFGLLPPQLVLSQHLAAMETALGIRAEQAAAWRVFTDALLAMTPPRPPSPATIDRPFAIPLAMAEAATERGEQAQALIRAVEQLRALLTPEQIERLRRLEQALLEMLPAIRR